jgi:hypothetical protein
MMINLQPRSILPFGLLCSPDMAPSIQHRKVIEYALSITHKIIKTTSALTFFASHAADKDPVRPTDSSTTSTSRLFTHDHLSHHSESAGPRVGKRSILAPSHSPDFAHLAV